MKYSHTPVLLHQTIDGLQVKKNSWYADVTVGGGGYTAELLKQGAFVLGIDADKDAITAAREMLRVELPQKKESKDYIFVQSNFTHIQEIVKSQQIQLSGIAADLGVSSYQLDTPDRGFSYRFEESDLDMRLDQSSQLRAKDIVQTYSMEDLYEIIAAYGEEERARSIAYALVSARKIKPIQTTADLMDVLKQIVKGNVYETASRVFQALRMEVNQELESLSTLLQSAEDMLLPNGRLAVVSFHSLEDRYVKREMKKPVWKQITKQPIRPDEEEMHNNPRSRSAKLRIAEKRE